MRRENKVMTRKREKGQKIVRLWRVFKIMVEKPRDDPTRREQKGNKEMEKLGDLLDNTVKEIKYLRRVLNENQNTKVKIKNSSTILSELVVLLELEKHARNVKGMAETLRSREGTEEAAQTEDSLRQSARRNDIREMVEAATKTEKSAWAGPCSQTVKLKRKEKWFKSTTIEEGNPLNYPRLPRRWCGHENSVDYN